MSSPPPSHPPLRSHLSSFAFCLHCWPERGSMHRHLGKRVRERQLQEAHDRAEESPEIIFGDDHILLALRPSRARGHPANEAIPGRTSSPPGPGRRPPVDGLIPRTRSRDGPRSRSRTRWIDMQNDLPDWWPRYASDGKRIANVFRSMTVALTRFCLGKISPATGPRS